MTTAIEVVYRIYGFKLYSMSPPVLQMQVHLLGMHMVPYKSTDNLNDVVQREKSQRSMLTEYFNMNATNPDARKYLYREFAEFFIWNKSKRCWKARQRRTQIGRLVYANPAEGERYYLWVLLNHVRGATSYESLRTWHGVTYETSREAYEVMSFVETDKSLDDCMMKSARFRMPCALRKLFATIIDFFSAPMYAVYGISILIQCLRIFAVQMKIVEMLSRWCLEILLTTYG